MALLEGHQDHAVVDADGRAVGECEVVGPCRQADVVDDERPLVFGNDFPNLVLDRLEESLGRLDASTCRCADVELYLPAVDDRKEVAAYEHQHRGTKCEYHRGDDRDDDAPIEQQGDQPDIAATHMLEASLECAVKAGEPASRGATCRAMMLAPQQQADG